MNKFFVPTGLLFTALLTSCAAKKEAAPPPLSVPGPTNGRIVGIAEIEPEEKIIALYPQTGGVVTRIFHDIGDTVRKGQVILELNSEVEQAQLEQARSKLATQQSVIASSEAQLASLKVKLDNNRLNYQRNQSLLASGGVTQEATDDSRFAFVGSQKDVTAAEANVVEQQDRLRELQADIDYYTQLVTQKKVLAPFAGRILSMDARVGNYVGPTQSIGDFAPKGPLMAVTEVDELYAGRVRIGQKAYIRPQGQTDTLGAGSVFLVSPYLRQKSLFSDAASNMEDRRVREVRVLLDGTTRALIGSRVECVIQTQ